MELRRVLLGLALLLCPVAGQAQIQTQSTVSPNVPDVGRLVEQSGPAFRANWQNAINDINYLLQNPGIRPFPGCVAIQVTACGLQSTWGPAYVPFDVAGIVTVDTVQGGIDINGTFGFIALYQGKGQLHNYPGWALTLNNDTTLALYYSAVGFLAPISFTASISGTTMTVTAQPSSQPIGVGHVLSGVGVTGGTTVVTQLTGVQGFAGTYQVSVSQTVGSETIAANPGQPLIIPQQWSPNYTWHRANCNGVLPDSIPTVAYSAATALCWNFNNVGETDFFNDPGTPAAGTFAYAWYDYNHSTHTSTQLMNIASASNTHPGAVLIGGNGVYPDANGIAQLNVSSGSNPTVYTAACSVFNTGGIATYYTGCLTDHKLKDNTVNNTYAVDFRAANTAGNDFAAVIGQVTQVTNNSVKGTITIALANNQGAALTTAATFNASGGVYVGTTPSDPGPNNLGVQGNISTGGSIFSNSIIGTGFFTIGTLPTCNGGIEGFRAFVTNGQTTPTFLGTVSTTGAVVAPVFCNGSGWVYG
jgi:hypothetical protein